MNDRYWVSGQVSVVGECESIVHSVEHRPLTVKRFSFYHVCAPFFFSLTLPFLFFPLDFVIPNDSKKKKKEKIYQWKKKKKNSLTFNKCREWLYRIFEKGTWNTNSIEIGSNGLSLGEKDLSVTWESDFENVSPAKRAFILKNKILLKKGFSKNKISFRKKKSFSRKKIVLLTHEENDENKIKLT